MERTTPFERMERLFEQLRREMYGEFGDWERTGTDWPTSMGTGRPAFGDDVQTLVHLGEKASCESPEVGVVVDVEDSLRTFHSSRI